MPEPVSAIAREQALAMRAFDATLSDEQIERIAREIDEQRALGAQLAPKKRPLANAVEPLTAVTVPDGPA